MQAAAPLVAVRGQGCGPVAMLLASPSPPAVASFPRHDLVCQGSTTCRSTVNKGPTLTMWRPPTQAGRPISFDAADSAPEAPPGYKCRGNLGEEGPLGSRRRRPRRSRLCRSPLPVGVRSPPPHRSLAPPFHRVHLSAAPDRFSGAESHRSGGSVSSLVGKVVPCLLCSSGFCFLRVVAYQVLTFLSCVQ